MSSASLQIPESENGKTTGIFSGNLSLEVTQGAKWNISRGGFCGMRSKKVFYLFKDFSVVWMYSLIKCIQYKLLSYNYWCCQIWRSLENRHCQFVTDGGATTPTSDMVEPYVCRMSDFWIFAIDNIKNYIYICLTYFYIER